jgi:EAL domain-containing protein (putative c-di-GMP-specific phosphodiesterase class I)
MALPQGEILTHYQPQVNIRTLAPTGAEVLARWHQPGLGFVGPDVFIPLAEEIGLIHDIGGWVLSESCHQARAWQIRGTPCRIAVNVSARQFDDSHFAERVQSVLEETGLDPALLELELTESALFANRAAAVTQMHTLRALGITFALDDFGVSHSVLSYLAELPVQRLKIDRSFLAELDAPGAPTLLASLVRLAHDLGLSVVAEGIETREHLFALRLLGCDEAQGYLFARPMPAADLEMWKPPRL